MKQNCKTGSGFAPFGRRPAAELASWLLPHAIEKPRGVMKNPRCALARSGAAGAAFERPVSSNGIVDRREPAPPATTD
jgi:hypothetical protein